MEPLHANGGGPFGREDLDHDLAVEQRVARQEDPGHPAARQFPFQDVPWSHRVRQPFLKHQVTPR